jgi:serine/threonine-protein kinase
MLGSPLYMSPEQVRSSNKVDLRSDLWSLGVIAFRCLTGHLPFYSEEVGEVLIEVCTAPVPRPSQVAPDLGPEVDAFFERALARDLDQRFQSATAFAAALTALAHSPTHPNVMASQSGPYPAPGLISTGAPVSTGAPLATGPQLFAAISSQASPPAVPPPDARTIGTLSPSAHTQAGAPPGRGRQVGVVLAVIAATALGGAIAFVGVARVQAPASASPPSEAAHLPAPPALPVPTSAPVATGAAPAAPVASPAPSASAAPTADPAPRATSAPAQKPPVKPVPAPAHPRKGDDLLDHI